MATRRKRPGTEPLTSKPTKKAHSWPPALSFIVFENNKFVVHPTAVEFLESLGTLPLAPIALAGPYRTGKSFLLNRILLQYPPGEGFSVGETINACTKGLHLSTHVVAGSNSSDGEYGILIIDTEGLGATTATDTHDCRIFSLALLLSSMFLYNSKGTIDQPAINNLSLVANISEHLRASSSGGGAGGDISAFFPTFLWVVRDFSLELVDADGHPIKQDDYLEQALMPVEGVALDRNKVRTSIRNYFKHRSCRTLCRPCDNESDLKSINTLPDTALKAEFLDQAAALREKILLQARPKQACGTHLTGALLARLAITYCEAINTGRVPAIQDAWSMISADECQKAVQQAQAVFLQFLADQHMDGSAVDKQGHRQPLPTGALEQAFTHGFEAASQKYKSVAIGDRADEFREQLRDALRKHCERLRADNMGIITQHADSLCTVLNDTFMQCEGFEQVRQQFVKLETQFYKQVGTDVLCRAAWTDQVAKRVWDWATRFHVTEHDQLVTLRGRVELLTHQHAQWDKEVEQWRAQLTAVETREQTALQARHDLQEHYDDSLQQIKLLKAELGHHMEELDHGDQRHQTQLAQLQSELESRLAASLQWQTEGETLRNQAFVLTAQLTTAQTELQNAQTDLAALRVRQQACLALTQQVEELEEANSLQDRHIADLTQQLNRSAEAQRQEIGKLHAASKETIAQLQTAKDTSLARQREATQAAQDLKQEVQHLTHQHHETVVRLQASESKLTAEVEQLRAQLTKERSDAKTELADLRAEASKNVKNFQRQLEENAAHEREEARKRAVKTREEQEKLFQEKVTALTRAQHAEARVTQYEEVIKDLRITLARERDVVREANYPAKLNDLEGKLATATTRHELMHTSLGEKADLVADQQAQITDLQAQLRQIQQQHDAEKMQIELRHARQMGAVTNG